MNEVVLDASALLAAFQEEAGWEKVEPLLETAAISAVNWSEVVQKSIARGIRVEGLREDMVALGLDIVPFHAGKFGPHDDFTFLFVDIDRRGYVAETAQFMEQAPERERTHAKERPLERIFDHPFHLVDGGKNSPFQRTYRQGFMST